jgi:hypothetical protein
MTPFDRASLSLSGSELPRPLSAARLLHLAGMQLDSRETEVRSIAPAKQLSP